MVQQLLPLLLLLPLVISSIPIMTSSNASGHSRSNSHVSTLPSIGQDISSFLSSSQHGSPPVSQIVVVEDGSPRVLSTGYIASPPPRVCPPSGQSRRNSRSTLSPGSIRSNTSGYSQPAAESVHFHPPSHSEASMHYSVNSNRSHRLNPSQNGSSNSLRSHQNPSLPPIQQSAHGSSFSSISHRTRSNLSTSSRQAMSQGGSSIARSPLSDGQSSLTIQPPQTVYIQRAADLQLLLRQRRIDLTGLRVSNVDLSGIFANKDLLSEFLLPYLAQGKVSKVVEDLVSSQMSSHETFKAREDAIHIIGFLLPPPPSLSQHNRGNVSYYLSWTQRIILHDPSSTDLFVSYLKALIGKAVREFIGGLNLQQIYADAHHAALEKLAHEKADADWLLSSESLGHIFEYHRVPTRNEESQGTLQVKSRETPKTKNLYDSRKEITLVYTRAQNTETYTYEELKSLLRRRLLVVTHKCPNKCMTSRKLKH